jgi:hypothetical protein
LPAAALIYRRGDVREAPVAVTDTLALDDLYRFEGASIYGLKGTDALWVSKIGDREAKAEVYPSRVDPLAFFVGRVKRVITQSESKLETVDLERYIDREAGVVRSLTGEVTWDFGKGFATIDTPRAQGACGFLRSAGRMELGDIIIDSGNAYGSILVVSLDGEPLASSRRILIQAGTEDRTHGYRTEPAGEGKQRIVDLGNYPLIVRHVDADVTLKSKVRTAEVLDGNGSPTGQAASLETTDEGTRISLPSQGLYTLVVR